ncbi:MAG: class I SAM-dependent methyltransferase [Gammaproteobacteria bacterium]
MKSTASNPLGVAARGAGAPSAQTGRSAPTPIDRWLAGRFAAALGRPDVTIQLWDGSRVHTPQAPPVGRIHFLSRRGLWAGTLSRELGFGDAYCRGDIDISGDLVGVMHECIRSINAVTGHERFKRNWLRRLPRAARNTLSGSRENIHHHYDLGNPFYALWLDAGMSYTCAYYPTPEATLEQAQTAKMAHVCRKLGLKPGEEVVEAGCGWGGLAVHMARHHGVRVRAYNISREQLAYARRRAEREGVADRVSFVEDDYRNIDGRYDAFVSIGMLEHVGPDAFETLGGVIERCLKPTGRGLIHSVGRAQPMAPNAWLERRIFPGSYPPSLGEMAAIFEPRRFSILDIENLRLHYARTLSEWLERFDAHVERVRSMYDETFVRAWRLYLAGCAGAFLANSLQLYQVLFAPPANNHVPQTRAHWYGSQPALHWSTDAARDAER